ncbi:MAG: peptidase S16 [Alphaproteobacteria bacterium]|nr:peptidase S16 [Alphaproteobacteria bacterium]
MAMFGYRKIGDLPRTIPVFPLTGALLLPHDTLPLNIFEPRYLNMIDDALAGERVIGMIQPAEPDPAQPPLSEVGTLGKITSFAETEDGRYLITLSGICRFRVAAELEAGTPYRQINAVYDDFADDMRRQAGPWAIDKPRLTAALERYGRLRGFAVDWEVVEKAAPEALVNAVATLCPFGAAAKQHLLEASTIEDRAAALIALLEIESDPDAERRVQ